jgi:hypothetical protein
LKFHPNAKKICESNLEASERFKAIEKIIKRQTILQHFIEEQINEADVDPFMANFYLSLKRWDVCLDSIKRHLNLLHIQNSALEQGKAELYNVNKIKPEMYIINQDIFIGLLYKAIPYFEGLGDYLHSQVILNSKSSLLLPLISQTQSPPYNTIPCKPILKIKLSCNIYFAFVERDISYFEPFDGKIRRDSNTIQNH